MNTQIYEEATHWLVEFRAGDADEAARRAFSEWVRVSPEHVRAYLEIAAIWNEGAALDPEQRYGDDELIALAADDNVIPLVDAAMQSGVVVGESRSARPSGTRRFAIAATLLVALGGLITWVQQESGVYRAAIGEQRSMALADGSTVQLNSRSKVRVSFDDERRGIELLEGQALFQVAKDARRPFVVTSGDVVVTAVGTQFDVDKRQDGTTVTVVEGKVEVTPRSSTQAAGSAVLLAAGQQVTVTPAGAERPHAANVSTATAWTQRRIVFDSATLGEVAQEFNRYNTRQIVLEDPDMTDFHISGVFSSTDPATLIRFLHERPGIVIAENSNEIRISRAQ